MSLHSKLELQPICLTHVEGLPSLGQAMWPRPLLVMAAVTLSEEVGTRRRFKKKKKSALKMATHNHVPSPGG